MPKVLNLGSGRNPIACATNVDIDESTKPDVVMDLTDFDHDLYLTRGWDSVICHNVINYFPSSGHVKRFFAECFKLLKPGGVLDLQFMNIANGEGLRLHYAWVKSWLKEAGFEPSLKTRRHWLVPTGNVRVEAVRA